MNRKENSLPTFLEQTFTKFEQRLETHHLQIQPQEIGILKSIDKGIAKVTGLPSVKAEEMIRFASGVFGIAFNLDINELGVILLGNSEDLEAGQEVERTGKILQIPVGEALLGRIINGIGQPLDDQGTIATREYLPIERKAPPFINRAPVEVLLQTGLKVVDALIPVGRGQRELIVGDRSSGKTAIAVDTILNQKGKDVICIYCAIGQRTSAVAKVIEQLRLGNALEYSIVVVADGEDAPGFQYITPYGATSIGEYFMERGRDVLIVYDDLTRHAWAYRELSLLLRRPPGREAYPGDIFYIHARMLERCTHLRKEFGGASLTALPIIETQAQNISAYIPTNLISITDGQIYLSPELYRKGILPAVSVGKSVSRVGGKTQLPAYAEVAGDLRLSYSPFQEVEVFARFGTQLDEDGRQILERGRRVREILQQQQSQPLSVAEQIAVLLAVNEGVLDQVPLERIKEAEIAIRQTVIEELPTICDRIESGEPLSNQIKVELLNKCQNACKQWIIDD